MPDPASADAPPPDGLQEIDPAEPPARGLNSDPRPTGDTRWSSPTPEELTLLLPDKYHVEARLGQGGMGAIYKGLDNDLDREVAIKLLPPEWAADEQLVSRFRREARTLAKLHHPSIVTIYDFGQTATGILYFVMEYITGTDLRKVLRAGGLPPEEALKVIVEICEALQAAHKRGVVHRDIKPENILIDEEGRVKLVDFGIARPPEESFGRLTVSGMMIGTPDYMSPEQRTGDVDERTDIYALGVVLYELLTGRPPRGVFPAPSRRVQIDVRIDEVVLKALQSDPEERYQKVSEMKTDVDRIRTTPSPVAEPAPEPTLPEESAPPPEPPPRRRFVTQLVAGATALVARRRRSAPVLWGTVALLVLLLVAAAVYRSSRVGRSPSAAEQGKNAEADWHVPGLNDGSFGGWSAFGDPQFEVHDGILTLTAPKWSGIASGRTDFVGDDLHLELAGSADVEAWVSIRSAGANTGRDQVTSFIFGHDGQVYAGHAGIDFPWADYRDDSRFFEFGRGRAGMPAGQFFSLDFSVSAANELTVKVNGRTTSVLTNISHDGKGPIKLCVKRGSLRLRKLEVQKGPAAALTAPTPPTTPTPPATAAAPVARTLSVPAEFPKIQAAIDAANPGDTVRVAAGEYAEQLVFKLGIDLVGAGQDKTTVRCPAVAGSVLTIKNCASGSISDLSFEHTEVAPGTPDAGGVSLLGSVVHLHRCGVRRIGGSGIVCADADWSTVEGCDVALCRREGISVNGGGTLTRLVANRVHDNLSGGIEFTMGSSGRAEGNTCENNALAGIYVADAGTNATVVNNRALNNKNDGIAVRLGATAQVVDNVCEGNHTNGIFARGPKTSVTLLRNQARNNRNNGIELVDGTSGRVEANVCEKNPGSGIVVKGVGGALSLLGNRCLDNQGYGIWVGTAANKTIVGDDNVLLRNAKGASLLEMSPTATPATPTPAASPPATATPAAPLDAVPDNAALDRELLGTRWSMGAWTLTFRADHRIEVEERNPPLRTWHWWTLDKDTVHIQYAAQSAKYDPNLGTNLVIDPTRTRYVAQGGDPQRAQKGGRLDPAPAPTPGETVTPAPTPVVTLPTGDKPVDTSAMKQVVNVQFAQSASGFATGEDKRWHLAWADGEYQMVCSESGVWIPPEPPLAGIHLKDFVVEVRGRIVRAADGGWGVALWADGAGHPWLGFMVNAQGTISHRAYDEKGENPCQTTPWPVSSAIKPGSQENTLRIEGFGERFRVFVNGQLVGSLVQPRPKQDSVVYLHCWGNRPPEACRFQSVQVWVPK